VLFAVIDKTQSADSEDGGALAGTIGYLNTSSATLSTEIGFVVTLPPFQRTHVTSNAIGLLLQYALDLPDASADGSRGGLGLRRVQWQADSANTASIRAAERMGFRMEGLLRWDRVLRAGKENGKVGNGRSCPLGEEGDIGRDSVILSLCWDDWEGGAREKVISVMERR